MDKKFVFILILISLCVGYFAGYFVGKESFSKKNTHKEVVVNEEKNSDAMSQAKDNENMEKIHKRIKELKEKVKNNPSDFDSLKELGDIFYDIKDFTHAINYYESALKVKNSIPVMVDLATCYVNTHKSDKAISILNEVLKEKPDFPQALYNLGIIYLHEKNDFRMAKKYWQRLYDIGAPGFDKDRIKMMLDAIDRTLKGGEVN